jgi:hypothetical protein
MLPGRIGTTTGDGRVEKLAQDRMALGFVHENGSRLSTASGVTAWAGSLINVDEFGSHSRPGGWFVRHPVSS